MTKKQKKNELKAKVLRLKKTKVDKSLPNTICRQKLSRKIDGRADRQIDKQTNNKHMYFSYQYKYVYMHMCFFFRFFKYMCVKHTPIVLTHTGIYTY